MVVLQDCSKERSCESCLGGTAAQDTVPITADTALRANRPPVANAGADRTISLPTDDVYLDGSGSADPDGNIKSYQWTKIAGPPSYSIDDISLVRPQVTGLTTGLYQFALTVTDSLGLSDKDTVQIIVQPASGQQNIQGVIFHWADPTGTVDFGKDQNSVPYPWLEWEYQGKYLNLVTLQVDTLSDYLAGVWCKNGCKPDCTSPIYAAYFGDKHIAVFNLPPGTYNWTAETTLNAFPLALQNNPGVSVEFFHYFDTVHKAKGTVTVTATGQCIIKEIVF